MINGSNPKQSHNTHTHTTTHTAIAIAYVEAGKGGLVDRHRDLVNQLVVGLVLGQIDAVEAGVGPGQAAPVRVLVNAELLLAVGAPQLGKSSKRLRLEGGGGKREKGGCNGDVCVCACVRVCVGA